MKYGYIGFVITLLLLIYAYTCHICHKSGDPLEDMEQFTENTIDLLEDGTPMLNHVKTDTAYISAMSSNLLDIYIDYGNKCKLSEVDLLGTKIGSITQGDIIYHFQAPFNPNQDSIYIYHFNKNGPCYWVGHIFLNGKYYPTNNINFSILGIEDRNIIRENSSTTTKYGFSPGYKRIGCYQDIHKESSVFPKQHKDINNNRISNLNKYLSLEKCREEADLIGSEYFALKNNGQCFSSESKTLKEIISKGKATENKCRNPISRNNYYRNISKNNSISYDLGYKYSTGGSNGVMDIHMTHKNPIIRYYGTDEGMWPSIPGANFKISNGGIGTFIYGAYAIQPRIGSSFYQTSKSLSEGNHLNDRWIQYKFNCSVSELIEFCPDCSYQEFNPQGCSDSTDKEKCENSTHAEFKYNNLLCVNLVKDVYTKNNYNNSKFITLTLQFFEALINYRKIIPNLDVNSIDKITIDNLIDQANVFISKSNEISCKIISSTNINTDKVREKEEYCLSKFEKLLGKIDSVSGKEIGEAFISNVFKATKNNKVAIRSDYKILRKNLEKSLIEYIKLSKIITVKIDQFLQNNKNI